MLSVSIYRRHQLTISIMNINTLSTGVAWQFTLHDIGSTLKSTKHRAPGASGVREIHLTKAPQKILRKRILLHFLQMNSSTHKQYVLLLSRGTTSAIAVVWEDFAHRLEQTKNSVVALRDVSKALDMVHHDTLLYKILQLGLPPSVDSLLSEFVRNTLPL